MKFSAKQLNNGNYAVHQGQSYFPSTETPSKREAEGEAIIRSARWYRDQADKCHQQLLDKGFISENAFDPYGYLA